jgi:hypothetical protein
MFNRFIMTAVAAISCVFGGALDARAALEDVCTTVSDLKAVKYKAIPSDHITTGPRVGGISLIYKKGTRTPAVRCLSIYDSNGTLLAKMGKYEPNGFIFAARYYSGTGCAGKTRASKIASKAFQATGNRTGYINVGGKSCLKVTDLRRDEGSVR